MVKREVKMCEHFPKPLLASNLLTIAHRKLHDQLRIKLRGEDIFHLSIGGTENSHMNGLDASQDEELRLLVQLIHHKREVLIRKRKR